MREFERFETTKKKEEKEKQYRQRLKQMNAIRKDEKEKVLAEIETRINEKIKYVQINETLVVPVVSADDMFIILQEVKEQKRKPRKFN